MKTFCEVRGCGRYSEHQDGICQVHEREQEEGQHDSDEDYYTDLKTVHPSNQM